MKIKITSPHKLQTTIQLPSSKSISNRVLVINALSGAMNMPKNLSDCDDTKVMVKALTQELPIVDIMAAGTAMRFLAAYYSAIPGKEKQLTGTKRMQQRPIRILVDALRHLGADIEYSGNEGFPPLNIKGRDLVNSQVSLQGNVSSQFISALLMIGPSMKDGMHVTLEGDIISRPYINLTLQLMNDFGAKAYWKGEREIVVDPIPYRPIDFTVENDWSAASYWYEMVSLSTDSEARIVLPNLFFQSYQGDSTVACLFEQLGVKTEYEVGEKSVILSKINRTVTSYMEYNFINQPDLAQTFVVTCAMLDIPFRFTGLQSLKIKETDRITALIREMKKLGFVLQEEEGHTLYWDGKKCSPDLYPEIETYEDHRMAMAFAPACMKLNSLIVNNPEVVSKSYPNYWNDLKQCGFTITENQEKL